MKREIQQLKAIFAARFKSLRVAKKKTQLELSELLDCSQQTINVWENPQSGADYKDINFPTAKALLRISYYFNVSIDWLFGEDTPTKVIFQVPEEYVDLVDNYKMLNTTGQQKVTDYITDLLDNPKYNEGEKNLSA